MKKVLVTGISGYVGQHCAAELLKKGYAVRGSVRNITKADDVINGIKKEVDPKGNLEFCELDLMKDKGWEKAMEGCEYVLHVASPFVVKEPKDEKTWTDFAANLHPVLDSEQICESKIEKSDDKD
jgi:dihydroflavonol-4-reductase